MLAGGIFVFSSLVKLIDPMGTAIKLGDYFAAGVLDLEFLMPYRIYLALILILLEWLIGWALILRFRPRLTYPVAITLMSFFLFLTGYTLITGKVTDCGCFGDAIKISPAQTFLKNIIILALLIVLYFFERRMPARHSSRKALLLLAGTIPALGLGIWTLHHLPIIDFRPYAVGQNIRQGMEIPPGAPTYQFKDIWYYRINGQVKKFTSEDEPWNIPGAQFVKRESKVVRKGYEPPIHDFGIENDTTDITDQVLNMDNIYLILIPYPDQLQANDTLRLSILMNSLRSNHKDFVIVAADHAPILDQWIWNHHQSLYFMDPTALKTAIRTRVGVMHLQNARIVSKHTLKDFLHHRP